MIPLTGNYWRKMKRTRAYQCCGKIRGGSTAFTTALERLMMRVGIVTEIAAVAEVAKVRARSEIRMEGYYPPVSELLHQEFIEILRVGVTALEHSRRSYLGIITSTADPPRYSSMAVLVYTVFHSCEDQCVTSVLSGRYE